MSRVAVIGASKNRAKFGNKAVRAYAGQGHEVVAIHPTETEIEGHSCYQSILKVPGALDLVSVYVRPEILVSLLPEIAEKGCAELWVNPGAESEEALLLAQSLGLNVIQACSIVSLGVSPASL